MRKLLLLGLTVAMTSVTGCSDSTGAVDTPPPGPPSTATPSHGITQGGAQDIGHFRAIVARGQVPAPETLDPVGFFAEHAVDLPPADCGDTVCVHPYLGVMPTFDGGNWTMAYVGMNTAIDPTTIPREPLHVVVAVEETNASRNWISDFPTTLMALAAELTPGDRISLVSFSDTVEVLLDGVDPSDPSLAEPSVGLELGVGAALYDALATAASLIESSDHVGASRIILVTTGRANAGLTSYDRVLELGASLARSGTSLSVLGVGDAYADELPAALGSMGAGTYGYAENGEDLRTMFSLEGRTSLAPIAIDFEMRIAAAPGYRVGDIYGARSATAVASEALLASPVLMVGNRTGSGDIGDGRRGGGGGLFVRLYADATAPGVAAGAPAFTVYTRWTDPVSGEVVERSEQVVNALRPGANPGSMWPHFSDPTFGKPFMMLNMYLALRGTVRLFHDGDCASSLGVPVMLEPSLDAWQEEYMDPDLDADWALLGATSDNVRTACTAIHTVAPEPVPPTNLGVGCGFI